MRQLSPDPPGGALLVLQLPDAGCWVATPCTLRITAAGGGRLGRADPIVLTRSGGLEVLSLSPEPAGSGSAETGDAPTAWLVRVIAFDDGERMTPALQLQVARDGAAPQLAMAPVATLLVQQRELAPGTALADIEDPLQARMTAADIAATVGLLTMLVVAAVGLAWCIRRLFSATLRLRFGSDAGALSWRRAARALRRLRRTAIRQAPPQLYSTMVTILRRTMVPRLGRLALSSTSSELVTLIHQQATAALAQEQLASLLAVSDEVKFAGHRPRGEEAVADCSRAIELVRSLERAGLTRAAASTRR